MKTIKTKRRIHNRPEYGQWIEYAGQKEGRKWCKQLRHKLLFHIPLTEGEHAYVDRWGITAHTAIDRNGFFRDDIIWVNDGPCEKGHYVSKYKYAPYRTGERYRQLNPKELAEND